MTATLRPLQGKTVLVTGGTGFIGRHVVRALCDQGADVIVVGRTKPQDPSDPVGYLPLDLETGEGLGALPVAEIDYVVHLAAMGVKPGADMGEMTAANVAGSYRLAAALDPDRTALFLNIGSCFEYGSGHDQHEDTRLAPPNAYAASKAAQFHMVEAVAQETGLNTLTIRPFMTYGVGEPPHRLLAAAAKAAADGVDFPMTDGLQERDFVHVTDVVAGIMLALSVPVQADVRAINLASGTATKVRDVVDRLYTLAGRGGEPIFGARPSRKGEIMLQQGRWDLARERLGWQPKTSLEDGLRALITNSLGKDPT